MTRSVHIDIPLCFVSVTKDVTLIGHNWGFLAGIHVVRKHPDLFDSIVILNTNSLPDGEIDRNRYPRDVKSEKI